MMKLIKYFPILILSLGILSAQNKAPEEKIYFKSLIPASKGVVATDNLKNRLYLLTSNGIDTLLTARGSGNYFSLSPDQNTIGVKIIDNNQKETPALFDLNLKTITPLHDPVDLAGQVSFSTEGLAAFTISDSLHLSDGRRYDLGNYSNLAPISPSGRRVAYNDNNDQIHLLDLETNRSRQITDPAHSYYYPQWSPDGKYLLIIRFDGQLCVHDIKQEKLVSFTEGHAPQWQDNETIIFYKKEIQQMQLVNTDLYSIKADGADLTQLTFTKDKLEIDPAVDFSNQKILYNTKNT
ncbi:MAG: TolB family protein, partial [bacterium]